MPPPLQALLEFARKHGTLQVALLAMGEEVVVTAFDRTEQQYDPTAHAPIVALRELGALTHQTTFPGYRLYVPHEPCPMCTTACLQVGLDGIGYGIPDEERYPALRTEELARSWGRDTRIEKEIGRNIFEKLQSELAG